METINKAKQNQNKPSCYHSSETIAPSRCFCIFKEGYLEGRERQGEQAPTHGCTPLPTAASLGLVEVRMLAIHPVLYMGC